MHPLRTHDPNLLVAQASTEHLVHFAVLLNVSSLGKLNPWWPTWLQTTACGDSYNLARGLIHVQSMLMMRLVVLITTVCGVGCTTYSSACGRHYRCIWLLNNDGAIIEGANIGTIFAEVDY